MVSQTLNNHDARHAATLDSILALKTSQSTELFRLSQLVDNLGVDQKMQDKKYAALKEQVNVLLTTSSAPPPPPAAASSTTTGPSTSAGGSSGQLSESDIDARIERIVAATVAKAIREEEQKRESQAKTLTEALAAERAIRSKLVSRIAKLEQQQHSGSAPGTPRRPASPAPPSTGGAVAAVTQVRAELRKVQERLDSLQTQVAEKRTDGGTPREELESSVGTVKSHVEELSKRVAELERGDANTQRNAAQKYQLLEQKINAQQKQLLVLKTAGGNASASTNSATPGQVRDRPCVFGSNSIVDS